MLALRKLRLCLTTHNFGNPGQSAPQQHKRDTDGTTHMQMRCFPLFFFFFFISRDLGDATGEGVVRRGSFGSECSSGKICRWKRGKPDIYTPLALELSEVFGGHVKLPFLEILEKLSLKKIFFFLDHIFGFIRLFGWPNVTKAKDFDPFPSQN